MLKPCAIEFGCNVGPDLVYGTTWQDRMPYSSVCSGAPPPSHSQADPILGGETVYSVRTGDCLLLVGARFGVDWQLIAKENELDPRRPCKVGQQLVINNRRIVPKVITDGIIVNIPDRMLYFFKEGKLAMYFPVGLGMPVR